MASVAPWSIQRDGTLQVLHGAGCTQVDGVRLVVVGVFPGGITQRDALVDATELGPDDALHRRGRRPPGRIAEAFPERFRDRLA